jgi:hypothetical protein
VPYYIYPSDGNTERERERERERGGPGRPAVAAIHPGAYSGILARDASGDGDGGGDALAISRPTR